MMNPEPTPDDLCIELLQAIVRSQIAGAPFLLASMLTLTEPFELLDGRTRLADGHLNVAPSTYNNMTSGDRVVPVGSAARAVLGANDSTALELLKIPAGKQGALLQRLREDAREVEVTAPFEIEGLWLLMCHALVCRASTPEQRSAVFAYAGIPATGARAARRREHVELTWVTNAIDGICADAGLIAPIRVVASSHTA